MPSNWPQGVVNWRVPSRTTMLSCWLRYWIKSAMLPILSWCSLANSSKSGKRAMLPSSFMISQMTAVGEQPAIAAKSQPASVWPERINTPPGWAIKGNICPGCTRSPGLAFGATAVLIVRARSAAEIPVVTPLAASIDTVKFVPIEVPLSRTIKGKLSCWQRSRVSVRQIRPRPCLAMKLTASALTWSAAKTRSPSFSRSSSSTRMTILPARISAMISSVEARVFGIALYFKPSRGMSLTPTAISRLSDARAPRSLFWQGPELGKIRHASKTVQRFYLARGFGGDELNSGNLAGLYEYLSGDCLALHYPRGWTSAVAQGFRPLWNSRAYQSE